MSPQVLSIESLWLGYAWLLVGSLWDQLGYLGLSSISNADFQKAMQIQTQTLYLNRNLDAQMCDIRSEHKQKQN